MSGASENIDSGTVLPELRRPEDEDALRATGRLRQVRYPNQLLDMAVLGQTRRWTRSFLLRPKFGGRYVFLAYPLDRPLAKPGISRVVSFVGANSAPKVIEIEIPQPLHGYLQWEWRLINIDYLDDPVSESIERHDALAAFSEGFLSGPRAARLAAKAWEEGAVMKLITDLRPAILGGFSLKESRPLQRSRAISWSCHQPYVSVGNRAAMHPDAEDIMAWYAERAEAFDPHQIWAMGDTAYSDGTGALEFVNQVYDSPGWQNNPQNREDLLALFRLMYRYHWSFEPMQRLMRRFPHLAMWDDHEIRDGHGSRTTDFTPEAEAMKEVAQQAAEEYLFSWTPRVKGDAARRFTVDNHQAYVDGPLAGFVFDGRNSRRYGEDLPIPAEAGLAVGATSGLILSRMSSAAFGGPFAAVGALATGLLGLTRGAAAGALITKELIELYRWYNPGEVISEQQLADFRQFCQYIQMQPDVKYLVIGNSVPFIYINDLVETILAELEVAKEGFAEEVRDDIRDSWHSPGNRRQLSAVIAILRELHQARPDLEIVNISGDIHVANAFSAQPDGFAKPIYQVTTSPLTNRGTLSEGMTDLLAVDGPLDLLVSEGLFGEVRRLWQEPNFQNFLEIDATPTALRLHLRVYNRHDGLSFGARDRVMTLADGHVLS